MRSREQRLPKFDNRITTLFQDYSDNELLTPNDPLISSQRYPGEHLRNIEGRDRFPIPDRVGEYCSLKEFKTIPKYMAQWVHWPIRAQMILEGRYHELPPVHFEGIFTLVCNLLCPHCTRRVARNQWVEQSTWDNNSQVNPSNTMFPELLKQVLDEVVSMRLDDQMGMVWGGGDPTANPFTYEAMQYAHQLGITSSFITNGIFLDVDKLLDAEPVLIRISLNCGTDDTYQRFHGYPKGWDYFDTIRTKMRELARYKIERKSKTLFGISLIADERNIEDIIAAVREIRAVIDDIGGGIDYVIARPVFDYAHFDRKYTQIQADTKQRFHSLLTEESPVQELLDEVGIPLVLIKDSFEPPPPNDFYEDSRCLAYGMCGEIRHNGDLQICSDSYGNPEYTIGNLHNQSLKEIWTSSRRMEVLERINAKECYKHTCPHNSRGHHYNRLFHQIEKRRRAGEMKLVYRWVEDLREVTVPLGHSFFI